MFNDTLRLYKKEGNNIYKCHLLLVLCRLRLRALSRPSRAVGSRGRHKPSLRPVTAHGSGFKYQKPEAAAQADGFL